MPGRTSLRSRTPASHGQAGVTGSIQRFTRASKPGVDAAPSTADLKGKTVRLSSNQTLSVSPSKKRKLNEVISEDSATKTPQNGRSRYNCGEDGTNGVGNTLTATPSKQLKFSALAVSTPRSAHSRSQQQEQQEQPRQCSVSQSTKASFQSLASSTALSSEGSTPPTSQPSSPSPTPFLSILDYRTGSEGVEDDEEEGREGATQQITRSDFHEPLNNFLDLHSSFLSAITLHFAQTGWANPVDLKHLLPTIERLWKKRRVQLRDLRQLVRIWDDVSNDPSRPPIAGAATPLRFRICNYGLGKVCLEKVSAGHYDENKVHRLFVRVMEQKLDGWVEGSGVAAPESNRHEGCGWSWLEFIESIGLAPVHEALTPFRSFPKGQQRLEDLKFGIIKQKTERFKERGRKEEGEEIAVRDPTTDRRKRLWDTIKEKQLRKSKLPPPPSKELLLRRSAAERVEEVSRVLALMRPAGSMGNGPWARVVVQKKPYRLETVVQNIQDSIQLPLASHEVASCIEILARKDIAGDWIEIVTVNTMKSVVLRSGKDVSPREICARVVKQKIGFEDEIPPISSSSVT